MRIEIVPTYGGRTKRQKSAKGKTRVTCTWNWRAVASNGKIVAQSTQGYERASDAEEAFDDFWIRPKPKTKVLK